MSKLRWTLLLLLVVGTAIGVGVGWRWVHAQDAASPSPETLLPASSILYIGYDGSEAHQEAWKKTAAYESLHGSGLVDLFQKVMSDLASQVPASDPQAKAAFETLKKVAMRGYAKGASLALSVTQAEGSPFPQVTLTIVLHHAADLEPALGQLVQAALEDEAGLSFVNEQRQSRNVTVAMLPPVVPGGEIGWWTEGDHLVIAAGVQAVNAAIDVAEGKTPNLTENPLWQKYRAADAGFEITAAGWFNFGALREMFGNTPLPLPAPEPMTVNTILQKFGLDGLGAIVGRSGYKGRAVWSEMIVEAPAPRKGLLALADQPKMTLKDLPPLPFSTTGFFAVSCDPSKVYDDLLSVVRDVASLAPPGAVPPIDALIAQAGDQLGFDVKTELLDPLGHVVCLYGDPRQSFGLGAGLVVSVDDAATLRKTIDHILGIVEREAGGDLHVRRMQKHGREIIILEFEEVPIAPALCVDEKWLSIGLMPQTVEAFLLRVDGKLTNWWPTASYQEGLDELPKEFTSITATDPRKSIRALMGLAPFFITGMQMGLREMAHRGGPAPQLNLSLGDLPPAELVARPLFPNLSVTVVDDEGIRTISRTSLPSLPLLGMGGGSSVATTGVLVALLLPAIQQAREEARRAQSRNNLKQIGLALHNYHDVYRHFPQGTHPNENLEPEKRLSWMADILPFVEQQALHSRIDFDAAWNAEANQPWMRRQIDVFINPGVRIEAPGEYAVTHYVGIAGVGEDAPKLDIKHERAGIFGYDRQTRIRDITDGTSNTVAVSEASGKIGPWGAGGPSTIRGFAKRPYINGPDGIGGPWSSRGCQMLFVDGSVRFISENIDPVMLERLAKMHDGEVVDLNGF